MTNKRTKTYGAKYRATFYVSDSKSENAPGNKLGGNVTDLNDASTTINYTINLNYNAFCSNEGMSSAMKLLGTIIMIIKIVVPIIIIVLGMIDFTKSITSGDENATSKALNVLIRRIVAGVIVFFVPTILLTILNTLNMSNIDNPEFESCTKCLLNLECGE